MPALRGVGPHPRVADFLARVRRDPTAWLLIVSNVVAVVLALRDPPVFPALVFVYWGQCLIIGFFTILKFFFIPITLGPEAERRPALRFVILSVARVLLAAFFVVHYGGLVMITGALAEVISGEEMLLRSGRRRFDLVQYMLGLAGPLAVFFVSHAVSFVRNFLVGGEYRHRTIESQMTRVCPRAMVMFLVVFFGGGLLSLTRVPGIFILVFVPLKIAVDLAAHVHDHREVLDQTPRDNRLPTSP